MKEDIYTFGMCKICKENKPLKNGICSECEKTQPILSEFFRDMLERYKELRERGDLE